MMAVKKRQEDGEDVPGEGRMHLDTDYAAVPVKRQHRPVTEVLVQGD